MSWGTNSKSSAKTINFGKVEKFKDDPLSLSYGRGNGFFQKPVSAVSCRAKNHPPPSLCAGFQERKIPDRTAYGASCLLPPKSQELEYGGRHYKTDKMVCSLHEPTGLWPISVRMFWTVRTFHSRWQRCRGGCGGCRKHLYDIIDNTIPADLDYSKCRIPGETATIIFQSGVMTGEEFDLEQTSDALTGYDHAARRFVGYCRERRGHDAESGTADPAVGDTYAVFKHLAAAGTSATILQTGASWDMFREAAQACTTRRESFAFTGELDGIWAKSQWLEVGGRLVQVVTSCLRRPTSFSL